MSTKSTSINENKYVIVAFDDTSKMLDTDDDNNDNDRDRDMKIKNYTCS